MKMKILLFQRSAVLSLRLLELATTLLFETLPVLLGTTLLLLLVTSLALNEKTYQQNKQ